MLTLEAAEPPLQRRALRSDHECSNWTGEAALLNIAGSVAGAHALVIGECPSALVCELIRRGCRGAAILSSCDRVESQAYQIAIFMNPSLEQADRLIRLARRALKPPGRLLLRFSVGVDFIAAQKLARSFSENGFSAMALEFLPTGTVVYADRA
jgi:hypothetical protein